MTCSDLQQRFAICMLKMLYATLVEFNSNYNSSG